MVENAEDGLGETKSNFVEKSGDVKHPKVEVKPNIDGASVHVEASLYVDSGILPLHANEVDTARFFPTTLNEKIGMTCLIGYIVKKISSQSAGKKKKKKKTKHETTGSRKCGCMFMVSGYLSRKTKQWRLNIVNGVHNHAMESALEGHMFVGRLKEDNKKIIRDLIKSKVHPKNIFIKGTPK
ncbi:FAR1 DNA-binding domain protein [Medicago truncatula]|uniref:FAR1 DNA-binding domain protein n=1 Tax=Medicago truncatula TaxID=3880 RepID=G7ZWW7_MEDTR|nr:FAR1 DNA-binding domain protein [Medicago truncatula]